MTWQRRYVPVSFLMRLRLAVYAAAFCCALSSPEPMSAMPAHSVLSSAEQALLQGEADNAAALLHKTLSTDGANGSAHLLLCRVYLSEELGREAVAECEAALANGLDHNSDAQDWTGRAMGQQAAHAGMLTGLKLALGVRTAFETAASLNPRSEAAAVDLGEYYTSAPAIVGGGNPRALALASRIETALPETAHRIRAMAAERDKDLRTAEREFEAAIAIAHHSGALVDLAAFYGRHGKDALAITAAQRTIAADTAVDDNVVEAASVLWDAKQPVAAEAALRGYLAHGERSDRAPVFKVHMMLGRLLAENGQPEAARGEYKAALALASQFAPARKGLASL